MSRPRDYFAIAVLTIFVALFIALAFGAFGDAPRDVYNEGHCRFSKGGGCD